MEALKDLSELIARNARPRITDGQFRMFSAGAERHLNLAASREKRQIGRRPIGVFL